MKLNAPCSPIDFSSRDIYGNPVKLSHFGGKKVLLAFFRDAACPFCNLRLYELTNKYPEFQQANLEIIAVFSSPASDVRQFVARHPRPFIMLSDPDLHLYERYGVQKSGTAILKALLFKLPRIIRGFLKGGTGDMKNPHVTLVPADFLISESGVIEETWYGRNTSDHIPMARLEAFTRKATTFASKPRKLATP
jgi:thioredoxin-dependent peroxiredoxin